MKKSTINANKIVRSFFREKEIVDFDKIQPGSKIIQECYIVKNNGLTGVKASFLVPKRRGETQPEPRFWIYNLNSYTQSGETIYLKKDKEDLLVYTSTSDFENSI